MMQVVSIFLQGATTLLVAQAKYYSPFQLTHMPREDRAQSGQLIESAMAAKGKTRNYYSAHNITSTVSFGM